MEGKPLEEVGTLHPIQHVEKNDENDIAFCHTLIQTDVNLRSKETHVFGAIHPPKENVTSQRSHIVSKT